MAKRRATPGSKTTPLHPGAGALSAPTGTVTQGSVQAATQRRGITPDGPPSKYNEIAGAAPPAVIQDIDPANWYSPFQPIAPFGPPSVRYPRVWDYRTGINLDYAPARFQMFEQLQVMSRSWGLLRTVIETRKDQLMRLPWAFQVRDQPKKQSKWADQLTEFFRRPDGKTRYQAWKRMYLEDLMVIDAPTIYKWKAVDGTPLALQVLNGATIKPLIDDAGRRPDYPDPAFQQIIKGLPMTNFDEQELLYAPMRPTPQMPIYGYSPVEQIYVEVMIGIKRLIYQSNFWQEGSMPELIVTVPETWTPQQTAMFQAHFDALMSGNLDLKSKIRFMPGGMKPFDIKNANGDGLFGEVDTFWARLICFAFSIPPTPFVPQMNRATAETAQETATEEGLFPLMQWDKQEVMDPIIQEDFGFDEIEFNYLPDPEIDRDKQATRVNGLVKEGVITRNEGRDEIGYDPIDGGDELTVDTANGPVPLKETVEAARTKALAAPDEVANAQETHDVGIAGQKKAQKQPTAGVGKAAGIPFAKVTAVVPLSRNSPDIVDQRDAFAATVAGMFSAMAPVIGKRVAAAIVAEIGATGVLPDDAAVAALAAKVADEVSLAEFDDFVTPTEEVLAAVGTAAVDRSAGQLRIAVGDQYGNLLDQVHEEALTYARDRAAEMVGMVRDAEGALVANPNAEMAITDTTREQIAALIERKLSPGEPFNLQWSIEDIVDDITGSPLFSRTRAALIAQAEVGMATGNGSLVSLELAAATGLNVKKKWSTSHDEKVCLEVCMVNELAGVLPLNLPFPSGDLAPLAHPRCRCALIGVVEPEDKVES